jgi:hypothetical protein
MTFPVHTLTRPFDPKTRIEMARHDAAAGRLTAIDAVEFAAEMWELGRDERTDAESQALVEAAEDRAGELRAEIDGLESTIGVLRRAAKDRQEVVRRLVERIAAGLTDPKALVASAQKLAEAFDLKQGPGGRWGAA